MKCSKKRVSTYGSRVERIRCILKYRKNAHIYIKILWKCKHMDQNLLKMCLRTQKRSVCLEMPLKWVYIQNELQKHCYVCMQMPEIRHVHMKKLTKKLWKSVEIAVFYSIFVRFHTDSWKKFVYLFILLFLHGLPWFFLK